MPHDGCVAPTKTAQLITERNMEIERNRLLSRKGTQPAFSLRGADCLRKTGGSRVAGIARQVPAVTVNQI
ncbi:hypothetical protein AA0312_2852 [Acetobacter tropicalis NRIC 0312]|nr:hypothetical protein AA0312_2852 [Acetobacter tropicalis NRIC 0312]